MAGEEVLIADGGAGDRRALSALAERRGLVPSVVDTAHLARERIAGKFFAAALVDLDLPGGGLDVIEFARERSRSTQLVAVTTRKNFEGAVGAFRAGCIDVVTKRPDEMPRIDLALDLALARYRSSDGQGLSDVGDALDELVKLLVSLGRQVYAGEIDSLTQVSSAALATLFVDDDAGFLHAMSAHVNALPVEAAVEMSAGGALDKIGARGFDLVVAKEAMADLPGSIVVNAAQQRNPECVALLYTLPGRGGRIERVVEGRVTDTFAPFAGVEHLAERVRHVVEAENARRRERRVLQVIRAKHADALRRYADAKRKLEGMLK